jgi:hypothetical protein
VQFFFAILHAHPVSRVNNPNYRIRLLEIISPVRPESPLTTDIPYGIIDNRSKYRKTLLLTDVQCVSEMPKSSPEPGEQVNIDLLSMHKSLYIEP